jgi:hypothetical protein
VKVNVPANLVAEVAVAMLRSEMRATLQQALEALAKRLAPRCAELGPTRWAELWGDQASRVIDQVRAEYMRRLADLAVAGTA